MKASGELTPRLEELTPQAQQASLRCVLIHGTWARMAPWTDVNSAVSQNLRSLAGGSVHLSRFIWSGDNDERARRQAGDALAEALADVAKQHGSASFLLIGHSHGGNVALKGVQGVPVSQQAGVVCMGTPFLHVRARGTFPTRWLNAAAAQALVGLYFAALGVLAFGVAWLFPGVVGSSDSGIGQVWSHKVFVAWHSFLAVCGVLVYVVGSGAISFQEPRFVARQQAKRLRRWQPPIRQLTPNLCIFYWPDEAFWGLRAARFLGEVGHFVTMTTAKWALPIVVALALIVSIYFGWKAGESVDPRMAATYRATTTAIALVFSALAIALVPVTLWAVVGAFGSLSRLTTGKVSLLDHMFLDIHANRAPQFPSLCLVEESLPVATSVGWLKAMWTSLPFSNGLVHSRLYSDERVFKAIRDWYMVRR